MAPERVDAPMPWEEIFPEPGPIEVEIGLGKGRFLLEAAERRPDVWHFGVEYANKYLRIAETRAVRRGLKNVRFLRADANAVMPRLAERSVRCFYVFYPDPWPKKRHLKRRFLRRTNADHIARILQPGGALHVATDHDHYWSCIEPLFDGHPAFLRQPEFGGPTFPLETEGALTNFEAKYEVEGRSRHRGTWQLAPSEQAV